MKSLKITGVAALFTILLASIYFSPYLTVYQMRNAIIDHDADAFSEHVNFAALKENLKGQLMAKMSTKINTKEIKNNPFAALGSVMAAGIVGQIVETMVSPSGVMLMLDQAKSEPIKPTTSPSEETALNPGGAEPTSPAKYTLSYKNWSTVLAHPKNDGDDNKGAFILKRDGLWSWKLSGIDLSAIQ
jgi:hypothetical protein